MRKLVTTALLLLMTCTGFTQVTKTRYFSNKYLDKETTREKGKFSQTTTQNPDGTITVEVRHIRKDEVYITQSYKGEEPTGIWRYKGHNIPGDLDYSFDLVYSEDQCTGRIAGLDNYLLDNDALGYIAPKLADGKTIHEFIAKNLYYPPPAINGNIEGRITLAFTVTGEGKVEDVVIRRGAHVLLDKEAARMIRKLKFISPPMVNGQPTAVCVTTPISFKLD